MVYWNPLFLYHSEWHDKVLISVPRRHHFPSCPKEYDWEFFSLSNLLMDVQFVRNLGCNPWSKLALSKVKCKPRLLNNLYEFIQVSQMFIKFVGIHRDVVNDCAAKLQMGCNTCCMVLTKLEPLAFWLNRALIYSYKPSSHTKAVSHWWSGFTPIWW